MANGSHNENRSWPYCIVFLLHFWASTIGGFRIVSDTLVLIILMPENKAAASKSQSICNNF